MFFFILGAGYVGKALLQKGLGPNVSFLTSTTTPSKIKELTELGSNAFLLTTENKEDLKKIIDKSDVLGIFIAPHQGTSYEETYLKTAQNIAKILETRQKPLYLIYTSSTFVYKDASEFFVTEEAALDIKTEKAKTLVETEKTYLEISNPFVAVCILRLGGIFGPGRSLENRARNMSGKFLDGNGTEPTNNTDLEDILNAIQFCITKKLTGIFNLVNDNHSTRKDLYDNLCNKMHIPPPTWTGVEAVNKEHGCGKIVSNQKIKNIGFVFKLTEPND